MDRYSDQFAEIIAQRLKSLNTNAYAVEVAAGLAPDAIRNVLRSEKKSGPTLSRVEDICAALGLELYIGQPRDTGPQPPAPDLDQLAQIPLHNAMLGAGDGCMNHTEEVTEYLAFRRDWLRKIGVAPSNAKLARASGDSMQPVIWDGDLLLIDSSKVDPPPMAKNNQANRYAPVFALLDDGQAKVKRLQMLDHDVAILISDNPDYPPQFVRTESLSIIGKVLWWGHTNKD